MGQQQLLLLVLGTVIVGIAVVAGISAFNESQKQANLDALVNDGVRIASQAQGWKLKPPQFGGGSGKPWSALDWQDLGYMDTTATGRYTTVNGYFTKSTTANGYLKLVGKNDEENNQVTITIMGTMSESIITKARSL